MNTCIAISLILWLLYLYKIIFYRYCWKLYTGLEYSGCENKTKISIVIAFRNELANLPDLLNSLLAQKYAEQLFEVVLVNDHSDDGSDQLAQQFCREHPNFRLVNSEHAVAGKKAAITRGIESALHNWIVTSDADCTMKETWLSAIDQIIQQQSPDMILGLVDMVPANSFFGRFQEVEFLSLVASGAGATAKGAPIYCNGANLAYQKRLFYDYADPMKRTITSGDDTMFLHTIKRDRPERIVLLKTPHAVVQTRGVATWSGFLHQRRRWVSKSFYYQDPGTIYTGLLVLSVNLAVLFSFVMLVTGWNLWLFPVLYTGKALVDFLFLRDFHSYLGKKLPVGQFLLFGLLYPLYTVFFAVAGMCSGFSWKGRYFRN